MKRLTPKHTAIVMPILIGLALVWEFAVLGMGEQATISEWVWSLTANPLVPFVAGMLMGHLFFPKSKCIHCGRNPYRKESR